MKNKATYNRSGNIFGRPWWNGASGYYVNHKPTTTKQDVLLCLVKVGFYIGVLATLMLVDHCAHNAKQSVHHTSHHRA